MDDAEGQRGKIFENICMLLLAAGGNLFSFVSFSPNLQLRDRDELI